MMMKKHRFKSLLCLCTCTSIFCNPDEILLEQKRSYYRLWYVELWYTYVNKRNMYIVCTVLNVRFMCITEFNEN
jgi:hypothetical protein